MVIEKYYGLVAAINRNILQTLAKGIVLWEDRVRERSFSAEKRRGMETDQLWRSSTGWSWVWVDDRGRISRKGKIKTEIEEAC